MLIFFTLIGRDNVLNLQIFLLFRDFVWQYLFAYSSISLIRT